MAILEQRATSQAMVFQKCIVNHRNAEHNLSDYNPKARYPVLDQKLAFISELGFYRCNKTNERALGIKPVLAVAIGHNAKINN